MSDPAVSVVVVSQDRPKSLELCLIGLSQLYYSNFEIIVVANEGSMAGVTASGMVERIKLVRFDEPNISAARNAGIGTAAGDIVAFIDDDAVPEPTWLDHLIGPFANAEVAASGGYVIGRNGISFQWKGRIAFADGQSVDLPVEGTAPRVFDGEPGRAIKTEGTNMAVRRDVLSRLGGFDEAFRFYLDETDLNMRIAAQRLRTAIVPLAQVHHGYLESERRTAERVPRDLTDIGRSSAIFARKHGANTFATEVALMDQQRTRLLRLMVSGQIMPSDLRKLLKTLQVGWQAGMTQKFGKLISFEARTKFERFESDYKNHAPDFIKGRFWQRSALFLSAKQALLGGKRATIYQFSFSAVYHRVRFKGPGIWVQSGGQFGKSERKDPIFKVWSAKSRVLREIDRTRQIRSR